MEYEWDAAKAEANSAKHGVTFDLVAEGFDWSSALVVADNRRGYGERRWIAYGLIAGRVHVIVFTTRSGKVRLIGARKGNSREARFYGSQD